MAKIKFDNTVEHVNVGDIGYIYGKSEEKPKRSQPMQRNNSKKIYDTTVEHINVGKVGHVHVEKNQNRSNKSEDSGLEC